MIMCVRRGQKQKNVVYDVYVDERIILYAVILYALAYAQHI